MSATVEIGLRPELQNVAPSPLHLTQRRLNGENYRPLAGDMAQNDHTTNVVILNNLYRGETNISEAESIASELDTRVRNYREALKTKYPEALRPTIASRYQEADTSTTGQSMEDRVRARLQTAEGIGLVSDFDGTISKNPNHYLQSHIPGSAHAEPMLEQMGRDKFSLVFAAIWREYLKDDLAKGVYFQGGREVELREGVNELFGYAKEVGADMTVLSANFEPFVEGGLSQIPNADGANLIAVRENCIISTDKGSVLADLAQANPNQAKIFIGDGSSDLPAMQASDVVACYFALEGSSFARELAERELPHFTYRTFTDIQVKLQEIYEPTSQQAIVE